MFSGKWLACQSMDNKICVFNALNRMKFIRKKTFTGHMVGNNIIYSLNKLFFLHWPHVFLYLTNENKDLFI